MAIFAGKYGKLKRIPNTRRNRRVEWVEETAFTIGIEKITKDFLFPMVIMLSILKLIGG